MIDYSSAIKRPFTDWKKFGIGVLLYLIPFLNMVTGFFAAGYVMKAIKNKGDFTLPEWTDWGDLFVRGLLLSVIAIIYYIPIVIITMLLMGGFFMLNLRSYISANPLSVFEALFSVSGIVILLLFLIAEYIVPAAIIRYARSGNFKDAFAFSEIFRGVFTKDYLTGWIIVVIYSLVLLVVGVILSALLAVTLVIPWVIMGAVYFAMAITDLTILNEALE